MASVPRSPRLYNLLSSGMLNRLKKGEAVFSTPDMDKIILVYKGYIKRYLISNDGSLGIQIIYGPQDIFSLTKVYGLLLGQSLYDGPEAYYYTAMCDVQFYSLDTTDFAKAVQDDPLLYKDLFSEAGQHLKACVHRIENVSLRNTYARVAHELLFCCREFGATTPQGISLAVDLTHQDIAHILGTTRETVTKAMIQLRQEGLISSDRHFTVLDLKGLERAAYHS